MILFLHGPDTFRSRQKLNQVVVKFRKDIDPSGLNVATIDGIKLDVPGFENAIGTPPFLAKKRLAIIERILTNKNPAVVEHVTAHLDDARLNDVIVVFWEETLPGKKVTKAIAALANRLKKEKLAQAFDVLSPTDIAKWVASELKQRNASAKPDAINELVRRAGSDTWRLNSELEKLIAVANHEPITTDMVKGLVVADIEDNIFALTDALANRNAKAATTALQQQLDLGVAPQLLLYKITTSCRTLLMVKGFIEANGVGYGSDRIAAQLKLHPYVAKKAVASSHNFSLAQLHALYRRLLQIDYQNKTSTGDPALALTMLVVAHEREH
jgi:DNA polymerase-3 subunit delta